MNCGHVKNRVKIEHDMRSWYEGAIHRGRAPFVSVVFVPVFVTVERFGDRVREFYAKDNSALNFVSRKFEEMLTLREINPVAFYDHQRKIREQTDLAFNFTEMMYDAVMQTDGCGYFSKDAFVSMKMTSEVMDDSLLQICMSVPCDPEVYWRNFSVPTAKQAYIDDINEFMVNSRKSILYDHLTLRVGRHKTNVTLSFVAIDVNWEEI